MNMYTGTEPSIMKIPDVASAAKDFFFNDLKSNKEHIARHITPWKHHAHGPIPREGST